MSALKETLQEAVESDASDVHIKRGQCPYLRVNGQLVEGRRHGDAMTEKELHQIVREILPRHVTKRYESEHEADFSHLEDGVGRFRVNVYHAQGVPAIAMRHVKTEIPSIESLHLPTILKTLVAMPRGIIALSGTTGSGKSTTLAALIQELNLTQRTRVVTIEDPIEYLFRDERSIISQREVGLDTMGFHEALRHVIRQDPDVIMIGEMRDVTSFAAAVAASETGHLVLTSLHAGTAPQAVDRILDMFPFTQRDQTRMALAANLRAIICQRLIPALEGSRVPAVEILVNSPTVRKLLRKDELGTLGSAIETGRDDGMQSFNQAVYDLIVSGTISEAEGLKHASNPEALRMNLQGIFLDEGQRILGAEE
jgi:pilus retraction protein PilT